MLISYIKLYFFILTLLLYKNSSLKGTRNATQKSRHLLRNHEILAMGQFTCSADDQDR